MLELTNILIALMVLLVFDTTGRTRGGADVAETRAAAAVIAAAGAMAALTALSLLARLGTS